MTGINFVMNDKGEKTALLIDLVQLKHDGNTETNLMNFIEDLEDVLAIELSQSDDGYSDWDDVEQRLRNKSVID